MSGWIEGDLDPYWEQGMEGAFLYNLTVPDATGPILLQEGDLLDILDADGELLWSGTFLLRKRRFWERHKLSFGVYSSTVLKSLSYGQWMEWLWNKPRLKARILRPESNEQIIYPWVNRHRHRPPRIRDRGAERSLGREILEWSGNRGTYVWVDRVSLV